MPIFERRLRAQRLSLPLDGSQGDAGCENEEHPE
jgi:hypothetical protein